MALSKFCQLINASSFVECVWKPTLDEYRENTRGDRARACYAKVLEMVLWLDVGVAAGYFDEDVVTDAVGRGEALDALLDEFENLMSQSQTLPRRGRRRLQAIRKIGGIWSPRIKVGEPDLELLQSLISQAIQPIVDNSSFMSLIENVMFWPEVSVDVSDVDALELFSFMEGVVSVIEDRTLLPVLKLPAFDQASNDLTTAFEWRLNCGSKPVEDQLMQLASKVERAISEDAGIAVASQGEQPLQDLVSRWRRATFGGDDTGPIVPNQPPLPLPPAIGMRAKAERRSNVTLG